MAKAAINMTAENAHKSLWSGDLTGSIFVPHLAGNSRGECCTLPIVAALGRYTVLACCASSGAIRFEPIWLGKCLKLLVVLVRGDPIAIVYRWRVPCFDGGNRPEIRWQPGVSGRIVSRHRRVPRSPSSAGKR